MRRTMLTVAVAMGLVVLTASAALAHECINVSRSAKGTAGAAGSNGWFTVTLDMLYTDVVADPGPGFPSADASAVPAMVADAKALGVPSQFVILAHATAAGGKGTSGKWITTNGHGIDHFVDVYFPQLVQAYCDNASGDPAGTICDTL